MLRRLLLLSLLLSFVAASCGARPRDSRVAAGDAPLQAGETKSSAGDGDLVIIEPTQPYKKGAWGEPVKGSEEEALVREVFRALVAGKEVSSKFSSALIVGPALWRHLLLDDLVRGTDELSTFGTDMVNASTDGRPPMPGRMYQDETVARFLRHQGLRELLASLSKGKVRPATGPERKLFYILIPFEIKGKALTVVDFGKHRLVASVSDGKIMWLDLLSKYNSAALLVSAAEVSHLHAHQSGGVLGRRLEDTAKLTSYAQALKIAIIWAFISETPSATKGLYIGIAVRPDGSRKFWIDSIGQNMSSESLKSLQESLQSAPPPAVREGPLLFSLGVKLWGHTPKFPDLVEDWRAIMKTGDHMSDEALSTLWR